MDFSATNLDALETNFIEVVAESLSRRRRSAVAIAVMEDNLRRPMQRAEPGWPARFAPAIFSPPAARSTLIQGAGVARGQSMTPAEPVAQLLREEIGAQDKRRAAASRSTTIAKECEMDRYRWDSTLEEMGGSLLQSWQWGEYRRLQGWKVERLRVESKTGAALAQVLFKHAGPISFAHIPRGPAISGGEDVWHDLVEAIDDVCQRHRAVNLVVEFDQLPAFMNGLQTIGFGAGPPHLHPGRTIKAHLYPDDELLAHMHASTRYHVRRAERRGVTVEHVAGDAADRETFYRLLVETCRRNGFPIHPRAYYDDLLELFQDDAALMVARIDGQIVAAALTVRFGNDAVYLHGGTSTEHRGHGAAHFLQWEMMRWARSRGCRWYDFWGIATEGLHQFKIGFGGEVIEYPPTLERRYRPVLAAAARAALAARDPIRSRFSRGALARQGE